MLRQVALISVFCVIFSLVLMAGHLGLRAHFGLPDDSGAACRIMMVWMAVACMPFALPASLQQRLSRTPHYIPLVVMTALMLPLLAWSLHGADFILFPVIIIAGCRHLFRHARFNTKEWLFITFGATLYAACYFIIANSYQDAKFDHQTLVMTYYPISLAREIAESGTLYRDFYFHATIIHMLQLWGQSSTGLDGLAPFVYHTGGHVWFASLGRMLDAAPLTVMPLAQLLIVFPALNFLLLLNIACLRKAKHNGFVACAAIALSAKLVLDLIGGNITSYTSVTYSMAMLVFLAGFPCLYKIFGHIITTRTLPWKSGLETGALGMLAGVCKLHVGAIIFFTGGYPFLRRYLSRRMLLGVMGPLAITGMILLHLLIFGTEFGDVATCNYGLPLWVCNAMYGLSMVLHQLWSWVPVLFFLLFYNRKKPQGQYIPATAMASRAWLHYEIILALSAAAALLMIIGSENMIWFANTAYWVGLVLVFSHPYATQRWLRRLGKTYYQRYLRDLYYLLLLGTGAVATIGVMCIFVIGTYVQWQDNLSQVTHRSQPTLLEQATRQINTLSPNRKDLAIFVPSTNTSFWSYGARRYLRSFYIPSITGIPMLMGLPPAPDANCDLDCVLVGYSYDTYTADSMTRDASDKAICLHARQRKIGYVLVLRDTQKTETNPVLDCTLSPEEAP